MCPGAEAGISNFLRGDKTSFYDQLSFLLGFKGGEGGAGGNFKQQQHLFKHDKKFSKS